MVLEQGDLGLPQTPGRGRPRGKKKKIIRPPLAKDWAELYDTWLGCTRCDGHEKRKKVVMGAGRTDATIMLIGQYPGRDEDEEGIPFRGMGGRYTHEALAVAGIQWEQVFFDNVLACRLPRQTKVQIDTCRARLEDTIRLLAPKVIVGAGLVAAKWLSGTNKSMEMLAARRGEWDGIPTFYTTHPMEPARQTTPDSRDRSSQKIAREYEELGEFLREMGLLPRRYE